MGKYKFIGIKEAAEVTADWGHSGCYTQTLLDRETLEVWTVTHVSVNNWCEIKDPDVTVVIGTNKKVSEQRLERLCNEIMERWEAGKQLWASVGCSGVYNSDTCYYCKHFDQCCSCR